MKFTAFGCNTTGILLINQKCRLKSLSRYYQVVNVAGEIIKKIAKLRLDYRAYIKGTSTWRPIIQLNNLDVCGILSGSDVFPVARDFKKIVYEKLPTLPPNCPMLPMKHIFNNITVVEPTMSIGKRIFAILGNTPFFPNGVYRNFARFYNEEDPIGFVYYVHIEINIRLNEDRF